MQSHDGDGKRGEQGVDTAIVDAEHHREGRHGRQVAGKGNGRLERQMVW